MLRGNAVGGTSGLDRVDCRTYSDITDCMDMNVEAGEVELLDEFHLDGAVVLQLTARHGALVGVKTVGFDESGGNRPLILGSMRPHILTDRRIRIDIACNRQMPLRILREYGLKIRFERCDFRQCGRYRVGVSFGDSV